MRWLDYDRFNEVEWSTPFERLRSDTGQDSFLSAVSTLQPFACYNVTYIRQWRLRLISYREVVVNAFCGFDAMTVFNQLSNCMAVDSIQWYIDGSLYSLIIETFMQFRQLPKHWADLFINLIDNYYTAILMEVALTIASRLSVCFVPASNPGMKGFWKPKTDGEWNMTHITKNW